VFKAAKLRSKLMEYYSSEGCDDALVISIPKGGCAPVFKRAESASGKPAEALRASRRTLEAREQAYVPAIEIAAAYAGFQNRVETLAWQHKAFGGKVHPIVFLYVDPGYRWLHDDRRFRAVLDRLRLRLRAYSRTTRPESPSTKSGSPVSGPWEFRER